MALPVHRPSLSPSVTVPRIVTQWSFAGLEAPSSAATSSSSISTLVTQVFELIGWLAIGEPAVTTCSMR